MSDNIDIVTNSLKYYDKNMEIYKDKLKYAKYFKIEESSSDTQHEILLFYDENKKLILKTRYEYIGIYGHNTQTWIWGWSIPTLRKISTTIIRKIFNYGAELDPSESFLKTELVTARFMISDPIQLDIHMAIVSYLSKTPFTYNVPDPDIDDTDSDGFYKIKTENINQTRYLFLLDV